MSISTLSIKRPILAIVINLIILLFGIIGYTYLGVREFPSIDAATISGDVDGTPGTEQFALTLSKSGGSATITSAYDQASNNWAYVPTTTTTIASQSAVEAATTYDVRYIANIATLTPAGTYSATINYIATATF